MTRTWSPLHQTKAKWFVGFWVFLYFLLLVLPIHAQDRQPLSFAQSPTAPLGQEADLGVTFRYTHQFTLSTGASFFFADDLMHSTIGQAAASWFYVGSQVNF